MAKRNWFSAVKKALTLHSKRAFKSKSKWFLKEKQPVSDSPYPEPFEVSNPHPLPQLENKKLKALTKKRKKQSRARYAGESHEVVAAIKIQTAFRGYLARRALRALRGLVRLKSLIEGPTAIRQTTNTLRSMQNLSRLQSQIQSRRMRMLDENRTLQRELLQKRARELDNLRMAEEWDDSRQSKEEVEAGLLHKHEGAIRRERALAYSFTHQQSWKKSKLTNILFMDPTNPNWGWSWLERYVESTPIETKTGPPKDLAGYITKYFTHHHLNSDDPVSQPGKKPPPKANQKPSRNDSTSQLSVQSERVMRRHSIAGSSIRDDESAESVPSYMTPTRSAKAKLKMQSRLGMVRNGGPDKELGFVKRRLSFPH